MEEDVQVRELRDSRDMAKSKVNSSSNDNDGSNFSNGDGNQSTGGSSSDRSTHHEFTDQTNFVPIRTIITVSRAGRFKITKADLR